MQQKAKDYSAATGFACLRSPRGIEKQIRRAAQAVSRIPREDVSPAGQWVEDHARLLLDAVDALKRSLRFSPKLPAVSGTPRLLLIARKAAQGEELTAGELVRVFRNEIGEEAMTQAEIDLLPQALTCALLGELTGLLDTCIQEPDLYHQSQAWAAAFIKGQKTHLPHDPALLGRVLLRLDEQEDAEALRRADELLHQSGMKTSDALRTAQSQWEQDGLKAGRIIARLRQIDRLPFDSVAERLSPVAAALRSDPTYRRMDADSRAYYRACACRAGTCSA